MNVSFRKVKAICKLKIRTMVGSFNMIIFPLMAILFVLLLQNIMPDFEGEAPMGMTRVSYLLTFGLSFDLVMGGIMIGCYTLAEEKEKHTLRVLMTSSVNSGEYFIGSIIPAMVLLMVTSLIVVPIAGGSFSEIHMGMYLVLCFIIALISLVIGFIIGMFSKNQMQAGMYTTPVALALVMIPMFRMFSDKIRIVADYVYPTVVINFLEQNNKQHAMQDLLVVTIWLFVAIGTFLFLFKKNGLDQD